jgi:uncharacterized protein YlxW (UPF0749 family)
VHLQCWNGRLFLKTYVQLMADEISVSPHHHPEPNDDPCPDTELQELRASARALRERAERLEAQLRQAETFAKKMRRSRVSQNGKQSILPNGPASLRAAKETDASAAIRPVKTERPSTKR